MKLEATSLIASLPAPPSTGPVNEEAHDYTVLNMHYSSDNSYDNRAGEAGPGYAWQVTATMK